jgi:hypothetical protein
VKRIAIGVLILVSYFGLCTQSSGQSRAPSITPGGIVPVDGTTPTIQPGEWVSIFGSNLANSTASWNGNFPKSLGGTSVMIDGTAAYLLYVSPGQINLQAPTFGLFACSLQPGDSTGLLSSSGQKQICFLSR